MPTDAPDPDRPRQVAVTVVYGSHAEQLDRTFSSFGQNPFLELHAFVLGDRLPDQRVPGVVYHLRPFEARFGHPMRDADFRRWSFVDELEARYALVVDGHDALCLRPLPEWPALLRGADVAACVEHQGARYLDLDAHMFTTNFLNGGVTFWDVPASREIRAEIVARGRRHFRNLIDDQLALNEVLHARHFDRLAILPCQFNYRAHLENLGPRRWPRVNRLDGVYIYHNTHGIERAKELLPVKPQASLVSLPEDPGPVARGWRQNLRRLRERLRPHIAG